MIPKLLILFLISGVAVAADNPSLISRDQPYHIQPSDRLHLEYRYTPEYDQSVDVQPDGQASISLIGNVKVAGLSVEEARIVILTQLRRRLKDPEITLSLEEFVRPSYVVGGEVANPGRFELHGPTSAIEAIAIAGGFKASSAKHSQVILYRRIDPNTAETKILNLKAMTNPAHPHLEESMFLQAGDVLLVPQNKVSKVAAYVHWVNVGGYFPIP